MSQQSDLTRPAPLVGAITDAAGRADNEDACAVVEVGTHDLLVVADGAGGHAAGEVASSCAVRAIVEYFETRDVPRAPPQDSLREALHAAHRAVRDTMKTDRKLRDMRTTALVVLGTPTEVYVGHVGDSRAYLVRDGSATRLTRDDSLVQSLVDIGQIDEEAAKAHSKANVLTQSIGDPKALEYHVSDAITVSTDDRVIACSDGLWEVITTSELGSIASSGTPTEVAEKLVARAIEAGASDNVTVGVMHWQSAGLRPMTAKHRAVSADTIAAPRRKRRTRKSDQTYALVLFGLLAIIVGAALGRWNSDRRRHSHAAQSAGRTRP